MANWIFTINAEEGEFKKRIDRKQWPIFKRTPCRKSIDEGDRVVFYKAGKNGQIFLGTARLTSYSKKVSQLNYVVEFKDVKRWRKGANIKNLVHELEIIGNPVLWSCYMQGGIKNI